MIKYIFLFMCGIACPVWAGYSEGVDLFNQQQYSRAMQELKPLADRDHERAQYYVAYMYLNGYGVPLDVDVGMKYLTRSSSQGFEKAQTLLGYFYSEGKNVPMDKRKAISLYTSAADKKDDDALLNLGIAYYIGDGVEIDTEKGIELLSQVNPSNKPAVGRYLGDIYQRGTDDKLKARSKDLYLLSASLGDVPAFYSLARLEQTQTSSARDNSKIQKYYTYAASQGHAPSQYELGIIYANGDGIKKDTGAGYAWFSMANNQGYEPAKKALATLEAGMTPSALDAARSKIVEIQQTVVGKIEPPIARAETRSLTNLSGTQKAEEQKKDAPKRRPPRSRIAGKSKRAKK